MWRERRRILVNRSPSVHDERENACNDCVLRIGTAEFEFNGPHAGPLFYRHLRAPTDRIGTHRKIWNGKHYGKHIQRL